MKFGGFKISFCTNCGKENPENAKFCMNCGYKLIQNKDNIPDIPPNGTLEDFKKDLDILKDFVPELMDILKNKKLSVSTDGDTKTKIDQEINKLQNELEETKRQLDPKLKVLNSDFIIITPVSDAGKINSYTFNISVDEKRLNQYVDYYKKINENKSHHKEISEPQETDQEGFLEDLCPNCKEAKLKKKNHKGSFGLTMVQTLECNDCGAVFQKKGNKYKLSNIIDKNCPIWNKYHDKTLNEEEWIRIRNGGFSDREQQKIDKEKSLQLKKEAEIQQQKDYEEFVTNLQNGSLNITTTDSCPVILKKNEELSFILGNISLFEPRSIRKTVGGYAGPTIRVAKGVSFRMGRVAAQSESHEELRNIDIGSLVLTNKRLIFVGNKRTTNIQLNKIIAIEAYNDGIVSQRENKQKTEHFSGTDNNTLNFNISGRSYSIPFNGLTVKAAIIGKIANL